MLSLVIHKDVIPDIASIRDSNPVTARRIVALIEQIKGDPDLLDRLTQHGYGADGTTEFDVSVWVSEQNKGRNIWRLKILDLDGNSLPYRIIYAFEPKINRHKILAIAHRSFDYDQNHPITQRIRDAYDSD